MTTRFHSFVVFAEMRTGSNFLETNLNVLDGVTCCGEAFNPHFVGYPNKDALFGISREKRDAKPTKLLARITESEGLCGFRYFHDHDPRIRDHILDDRECAKIILTRDPLESYVSWKIAQTTGQWKLTNVTRRKAAKAHFEPVEYADYQARLTDFRYSVMKRLQITGQTAFQLTYEDLQSVDVINGLATFLGVSARLNKLDKRLKVQNPQSVTSKVSNVEQMKAAVAETALFSLEFQPNFEPRRSAVVPSYVIGAKAPLVFLPIRGAPQRQIKAWMATLDTVQADDLPTDNSQKTLRQWKRKHIGHRSFTVLRHPLLRAHSTFCEHILGATGLEHLSVRQTLINHFGLQLPDDGPNETYGLKEHYIAFCGFLRFLKANLNGQTAIRVDSSWSNQASTIQGFAGFAAPDLILREDELGHRLPDLAEQIGYAPVPFEPGDAENQPYDLNDIYDEALEDLAASAYQRDFMIFGFGRWR